MEKESATSFFGRWEPEPIDGWASFQQAVNRLTARYSRHRLLWRGARDANWGIHSSLSRRLADVLGRYPTEDEMVRAERHLFERARTDWRFDGVPALELLAQLQHFGGPTRLLDVTENPLTALWFAGEAPKQNEIETDGRLFAFVAPLTSDIRLNENWGSRDPLWHQLRDDTQRETKRWGTGLGRRYWRPPQYHSRIASQSAGFLIDGVPIEATRHGIGPQAPGMPDRWTVQEMREFSSITLKLTMERDGELPAEASPVFTFRVLASAKEEIRTQLEDRYAIRASTVYPDLFGLAHYFNERPAEMLR